MKNVRIACLFLGSLVLGLASVPAQAMDMSALAGIAMGALTNGGLGGQRQGYGYPQQGYGAYQGYQQPRQYPAYGGGYGGGYDAYSNQGGYGGRNAYAYGAPQACRLVKMRGVDAYGQVVVERRQVCN